MEKFFLLVEVASYLFAIYLFFKKKELALTYIPVLIFSHNIIEPIFSASVYYGTISCLILYCIFRNGTFYKSNIFALLLVCYFLLLLTRSNDLAEIRSQVFHVFWLLLSIPLIGSIYKKHTTDAIFKELVNSAILILLLFIVNVALSTYYNYSPTRMYGIARGILYGNVYAAGFNILAIALFVVALRVIVKPNIWYFLVAALAYIFIMLSLRRSVMLISSAGIILALLTLLLRKEAKKFVLLGSLVCLVGFLVYSGTNFKDEFQERYETRQLDDRALEDEPRMAEYELIYKDMFVYNAYSPLIGFEMFNSAGNYGKGVFEKRTLHGDLPGIAHSSGFIGLGLYFLMIITIFRNTLGEAVSATDKLIVFFSAAAFLMFTITGRFTESASMLMIFLLLGLPLTQREEEPDTAEDQQ
jgi:hypothetical protein